MAVPVSSGATGTCVACRATLPDTPAVRLHGAHLKICSDCRSWTYFPRPTAGQQFAIHDSEQYFEHPYFDLRRENGPRQRQRCRRILARLAEAVGAQDWRGTRLLDIGCDTGAFLAAAAEEGGVVPVGVDVAERSVAEARRRGIEVYHGAVEQAPASLSGFLAITAIDLIEHVSDPGGFLREVFRRLQPGGAVYLETPNIGSAVYTAGRIWSSLLRGRGNPVSERIFPVQHIQYFTEDGLSGLARQCGFEVAHIGNRVLPWRDIAASPPVRAGMEMLQAIDRLTSSRILICAVLRRPR